MTVDHDFDLSNRASGGDDEGDADALEQLNIPEAFHVHDSESANWVVRHVMQARAYADRVRAWAAAEIRRAENEERFFLQRYETQLKAWARNELMARGGRRRSINLPAGTLGFRASAVRLAVTDERALLAWCRVNLVDVLALEVITTGTDALRLHQWQRENLPEARVRESIHKSLLDDHFRRCGECPNGTAPVGGEHFFLK